MTASYSNIFQLISIEFEREKIPFILIGGYAVNVYKVSRATKDVDFLIALEDLSKAIHIMEENGYCKFEEGPSFARLRPVGITGMIVDLVIVDRSTLDKMIHDADRTNIAGVELMVPSLMHLIALKLHAIKNNPNREFRDLIDIFDLIKNNKVEVSTDEFRLFCLKFGTSDVYNKIVRVMT